jgi:glycosyltransferase involved in cell wall biosynthesis
MRGTKRLLIVTNSADNFLSHRGPLARAALAAGYEVHVATPPAPSTPAIDALGARFWPLPLRRGMSGPWRDVQSMMALARIYRAIRPDLIHHVTIKPVLYGSLVARWLSPAAVVNAVSGMGSLFVSENGHLGVMQRTVLAGVRIGCHRPRCRVIFQNVVDRGLYVELGIVTAEQAVLIEGVGVDLEAFQLTPEPPGIPVVVLPARLIVDKGVREFVAAARELNRDGRIARFALVGDLDPDNPSAIRGEEIERWVAEGVVEWWGYRSDMLDVLAQSTVVCLPSYREGFPKVLLEAAAAGRTIVTSDAPGCRDVVGHDVEGLIADVRSASSLARALGRVLGDARLRDRLRHAARRRAEARFGADRSAAATLQLYRDLLA